MTVPFDLLRSGYPYYMTLGQRRVTSNPVDIGFGKENAEAVGIIKVSPTN